MEQNLNQAIASIDDQDFETRDITGRIIAIDPAMIPEIKEKIRQFRREIVDSAIGKNCSPVYHLSLQFYRLDRDTITK